MVNGSAYSGWDEGIELQCLIIFKRLFVEDFPRGKQIEYCRDLSTELNISADRLSARVRNFKAAAGMNETCEASAHTIRFYNKHRHTSIDELETMLSRL